MPFGQQAVGRDREVVEHAIARAGIMQRVVAPRGAVGGIAVGHRQPCGQVRAAIGVLDPRCNALGHGKADPALLVRRNLGAQHLVDVVGAMDRLQPRARHRIGRVLGQRMAAAAQLLHHHPVLVEPKRAPRWWRRSVVDMVDDVEHRFTASRCVRRGSSRPERSGSRRPRARPMRRTRHRPSGPARRRGRSEPA